MARSEAQKRADKKYDEKRKGKRSRSWTALIYADSAPEGWEDLLAEQLVQAIVSPWHDRDTNPDGEPKKKHKHVVLSYMNPVGREKAAEVFEVIGAVMPPGDAAKVKDFRQMARYLCHLDQPSKAQYDPAEVRTIGGIDYLSLIMSASDEDEVLDEMEEFIQLHRIVSFTSFQKYVRKCRPEWRYFLRHKFSYYIRETIKANAWDIEHADFVWDTELLDEVYTGKTDEVYAPRDPEKKNYFTTDDDDTGYEEGMIEVEDEYCESNEGEED